jgi:hypothetical protein
VDNPRSENVPKTKAEGGNQMKSLKIERFPWSFVLAGQRREKFARSAIFSSTGFANTPSRIRSYKKITDDQFETIFDAII